MAPTRSESFWCFGARAGKAAVEYLANCAGPSNEIQLLAQATDEEHRLEQHFRKDNGTERIAKLSEEMQRTMESGCGIYRERGTLIESANKISELKERAQNVRVHDQGRTFKTQLTAALELGFMLDLAETIVHCALNRAGRISRETSPSAMTANTSRFHWSHAPVKGRPGSITCRSSSPVGRRANVFTDRIIRG